MQYGINEYPLLGRLNSPLGLDKWECPAGGSFEVVSRATVGVAVVEGSNAPVKRGPSEGNCSRYANEGQSRTRSGLNRVRDVAGGKWGLIRRGIAVRQLTIVSV